MQECAYVLVPCDTSEPIQELRIKLPEGKEVEAFLDKLKKHFGISSGSKTAAQRAAQKEALIKQVGDAAARNLSDDLWETALNMNMVENIGLLTNSPETGFVGVNMYCDDEGTVKGLPVNVRASGIARCCGKMLEVRGDAFLGRVFDNEDEFKRLDFTAEEVSSSAPWIVQAGKISMRKATEESAEARLEKIERAGAAGRRGGDAAGPSGGEASAAEREKEKGNAAFKRGKWEEAAGFYSAAIKLDSTMTTAFNNRAMTYLKLNHFEPALADCEAVLERDPGNVKAQFRKACALEGLGSCREAIMVLQQVLMQQPLNKEAAKKMHNLIASTAPPPPPVGAEQAQQPPPQQQQQHLVEAPEVVTPAAMEVEEMGTEQQA